MILKDKDSTRLVLKCECRCSGLEFIKFDWSHPGFPPTREYYIYHTINSFDAQQNGFFSDLKRRFKMALNILWKGTYHYNEICLSAEDFKELQEVIVQFSRDYSKWTTAKGEVLNITDMTSEHILNCIECIEGEFYSNMPYMEFSPYTKIFNDELASRVFKEKQSDNLDWCHDNENTDSSSAVDVDTDLTAYKAYPPF